MMATTAVIDQHKLVCCIIIYIDDLVSLWATPDYVFIENALQSPTHAHEVHNYVSEVPGKSVYTA